MEKRILLIGIGETGSRIVDAVSGKMHNAKLDLTALSVLTEKCETSRFGYAQAISMASRENFAQITERLGAECISHWLPEDVMDENYTRNFSGKMDDGAGAWRAKAMLLLVNYLSLPEKREELDGVLSALCESCAEDDEIMIYTVADIGDGAGSGLLVPLSLYIKRYIRAAIQNKITNTAMVIGASVYSENQYCEELYVKAYANMYACMRELHAINLAAHSTTESNEELAPVSVRIGEESDPVGVLFNSADPEFCTPEAKPFSKVCIFDRVPNVQEGTPYEIMLSDILYTVCSGSFELDYGDELSSKTVDAIYSGIAMRSISYPEDSIVTYISKQSALCELHSWYSLHEKVKEAARREILSRQKKVIRTDELFLEYCNGLIRTLDKKYKEDGRSDVTADVLDAVNGYIAKIHTHISDHVSLREGKIYELLNEKIPEKGTPEYKKYKPDGYFALRRKLIEAAGELKPYFEKWFASSIEIFKKNRDAFAALLSDGDISVRSNILQQNGEFYSPTLTLYGLCHLYLTLKDVLDYSMRISSYEMTRDDGEHECSRAFFSQFGDENSGRIRGKYAKQGKGRLLRVFESGQISTGGMSSDKDALLNDVRGAYSNAQSAFSAEWLQMVLDATKGEIDRYLAVLGYMRHIVPDWSDEVESAGNHISSVSFPAAKIRISASDVKHAYEVYVKEYEDDEEYRAKCDKMYGEIFYNVTRSVGIGEDGEAYTSRDLLEELWQISCRRAANRLREDPFFENHLKRNILDAIMTPNKECFPSQNISDQLAILFAPLYTPLRLDTTAIRKKDGIIKSHTDFIFPTSSKESAQRLIDNGISDASTPEELIRGIIIKGGAYEGNVTFSDSIDPKRIFVCCETSGLRLDLLEQLNEMSPNSNGYVLYKEALNRQTTFESIVWGPHICYKFDICGSLPYISPAKQKIYELELCESLAHALTSGIVSPTKNDEGVTAYSYITKDGREYLTVNEDVICEGEYDKLLLWLSQNPSRQRAWQLAYRKRLRSECSRLPIVGCFGDVNLGAMRRHISASEFMIGLRESLMPIVNSIRKNNAPVCGSIFAERYARMCYDTLITVCDSRYQRGEDNYTDVYMHGLRFFVAAMTDSSHEAAVDLMGWLNERGLFKAYVENNEMCNYIIPETDVVSE